jgi:hypothetical protein
MQNGLVLKESEWRNTENNMVDKGFKDYVEVPSDNESPNRMEDGNVFSATEIVANFVDKIPEVNVKFHDDTFILSTQIYAAATEETTTEANLRNELDAIVVLILENLKENSYSKAKAEYIDGDFEGMGWGTNRNILYAIRCSYTLSV